MLGEAVRIAGAGRWLAALAVVGLAMALAAASALGAASGGGGASGTAALPVAAKQLRPAGEATALRALNAQRRAHGLRPLRVDGRLRLAARSHSTFVARLGALSHEGNGGASPWQRIARAGYPANRWLGETLAMMPGCRPAVGTRAVSGWLNSAPHRAIVLDPRYTRVGIGVIAGRGCGQSAITADFGS